ncbi:MAG TPA: hypothetical protein VG756_08960 [Pseudonocardiaceae bacterium]|nr:hypothetical protein [Pseudonocardiaceae bacterium]
MQSPITVNYVPDGKDWSITVDWDGQTRKASAAGLIAARDRADQIVEKVATGETTRTVVHMLDGDAYAFTTSYLHARLGLTEVPLSAQAEAAAEGAAGGPSRPGSAVPGAAGPGSAVPGSAGRGEVPSWPVENGGEAPASGSVAAPAAPAAPPASAAPAAAAAAAVPAQASEAGEPAAQQTGVLPTTPLPDAEATPKVAGSTG